MQWEDDRIESFDRNNKHDMAETWTSPANNGSFGGEFEFQYAAGGNDAILMSYQNGYNKCEGFAVGFEGKRVTFWAGNGRVNSTDGWSKVQTTLQFPNHVWCKVVFALDTKNNKMKICLSKVDGAVIEDVEVDWNAPGDYVAAQGDTIYVSPNVVGRLPHVNGNPYMGHLRKLKLYSLESLTEDNYDAFKDIPLNVNELSVTNLINLIDQYVQDRDYIKKAVSRLKVELQEEIDLNNDLKNLSTDDASFLVKKITDFVNTYKSEIEGYEKELRSIHTQLLNLITKNKDIMDNNLIIKETIKELDVNNLTNKVTNIRSLIRQNVQLLKENNRWDDTQDQYWKFNNSSS